MFMEVPHFREVHLMGGGLDAESIFRRIRTYAPFEGEGKANFRL